MLHSVCSQLLTDVLELPVGPIFKNCLALRDGTDRVSQNVTKGVATYALLRPSTAKAHTVPGLLYVISLNCCTQ